MVYIEHDTTEPVIEQHAPAGRWPTRAHRSLPKTVRWFLMGAAAAVILYAGCVVIGWNVVSDIVESLGV